MVSEPASVAYVDGLKIAYKHTKGNKGVLFCNGFRQICTAGRQLQLNAGVEVENTNSLDLTIVDMANQGCF